jgi:hypothetical protein
MWNTPLGFVFASKLPEAPGGLTHFTYHTTNMETQKEIEPVSLEFLGEVQPVDGQLYPTVASSSWGETGPYALYTDEDWPMGPLGLILRGDEWEEILVADHKKSAEAKKRRAKEKASLQASQKGT